jgi:hypothetical protein
MSQLMIQRALSRKGRQSTAAQASRQISPASPAAVGLMFLLNEVAGFALASITWDRAEKMARDCAWCRDVNEVLDFGHRS